MQPEFWHDRWKNRQIGFHQSETNPHLVKFWKETETSEGAHVLVPLCGKSRDMVWFCERGYRVTGVELSEVAFEEFCRENHIEFSPEDQQGVVRRLRPDFNFICDDFFNISHQHTGTVDAVYDRASLIALPQEMRKKYANHLGTLLRKGGRIMLITMEYDQGKMPGPPFSVSEKEVNELFGHEFEITKVMCVSFPADRPQLAGDSMVESIYLLTKK